MGFQLLAECGQRLI